MQFHLNGFEPGDPRIRPANDRAMAQDALPDEVDVLIVGSGPAGLTLAAYLSRFPEITTRLVEQKHGPMERGQADGVSCRSMEMFQAFGFAGKVMEEACWVNETTFWKPDPARPANIVRSGRVQDVEDGLSEMPHVVLNQARIHDMYLEVMRNAPTRLVPSYSRQLVDLAVDASAEGHPVTATVRHAPPGEEERSETVRARYVVGCDGARSAVRQAIGRSLHGDAANKAWGVMDVLAVTDFPDIRQKSLIQSEHGTIVIIPREGGYLVRLYVELESLAESERVRNRNITLEALIAAAQRIFRPYDLDVRDVVWWSVYEIGQRLTDRFDDVPEGEPRPPRVLIAGDACHTHSPKAGQGMNVSMGDGFNLGWKLVSVLTGRCAPELLHSYSAERQAVAKGLIDFDREWARVIAEPDAEGGDAPKFQRYFIEHGRYTAGVAVRYEPSQIIGPGSWQDLAQGFEIGTRFHSAPVVRLGDAKRMQLGHVVSADARWHVFAFAGSGDATAADSGLARLSAFLTDDPRSPVRRYTPEGADPDAVIDVHAVLQVGFREVEITALPPALRPRKGRLGLVDYEKVFCADQAPGRDIFDMRGIDREAGCVVVVRPDQHVAHVLPIGAHEELAAFFDGFMLAPA